MRSINILTTVRIWMIVVSFVIGASGLAFAEGDTAVASDQPKAGTITLTLPKVGGTIQMLGVAEHLKDDYRSDNRIYLFQKEARLNVSGTQDSIDYYFQLQFGGEEVPKGRNGNVGNTVMSLLDAYVDIPLMSKYLGLRVGQFKVPFSREMISDTDYLQFADYSINAQGFNVGRDVGLAFHSAVKNFEAAFGVFTGGGINIPQRYLPQELNIPMTVARVGYNTLDKNILTVEQFNPRTSHSGVALYVSGMYEEDSRIGHSSVLAAKQNDVSLFYNTNWNPYLRAVTASQVEMGKLMQFEADIAFQVELGRVKINGAAEANYGKYENSLGSLEMKGGEVQGGIYLAPVQLSLRYAVLFPDSNFGYFKTPTIYPIVSKTPIHEINPGMNIFFGDHVKLTMDMQIWIGVPVATEVDLGAYNLMTMPDQSKLAVTSGAVERQNAITGRMNFQFMF